MVAVNAVMSATFRRQRRAPVQSLFAPASAEDTWRGSPLLAVPHAMQQSYRRRSRRDGRTTIALLQLRSQISEGAVSPSISPSVKVLLDRLSCRVIRGDDSDCSIPPCRMNQQEPARSRGTYLRKSFFKMPVLSLDFHRHTAQHLFNLFGRDAVSGNVGEVVVVPDKTQEGFSDS